MSGSEADAELRAAAQWVVLDCAQNPEEPVEGPEGVVMFGLVHPDVLERLRVALAAAVPVRCGVAFSSSFGDRRCDREVGHAGFHVRNDGAGRPEYHWSSEGARS